MPLLLSDRAASSSPLSLVTSAEARMLGIRLASSAWHRVRRGVYADRDAYTALSAWERYAVRVHAFLRSHPGSVLCLESAAAVLGLPAFGEARDIHVFEPGDRTSRRFGDVAVHTSADPREVQEVNGVLVTGVADTVVDLVRVLPPAQGLSVANAALSPAQGGTLRIDELTDRAEAQRNTRGRARLRWAWSRADARAESPAESVSRAVIEWSGFERPELQREFHYEGRADRVDFSFASCRVIGEADGWQKYDLADPERAAERLRDEKRREDRLRRNGHPVARWDLADAWRVTPLCRALRAAGVPLTAPPQPAMLKTLSHRPRSS